MDEKECRGNSSHEHQEIETSANVSVALHPGDDAPESSSGIFHVSLAARNQVDVSMIDRLPCCITTVRADIEARHPGVIVRYAPL